MHENVIGGALGAQIQSVTLRRPEYMFMQSADELVSVSAWRLDEEFPIFPVGSKPKRAVICPPTSAHPFLIPEHRYLFKVSAGWRVHQHWSELVAYRLAALIGLAVPPCHLAVDESSGEVGVLIEFFYGHPGSVTPRFVPGADLMKRVLRDYDEKTGKQHNVLTNIRASSALGLPEPVKFWGATFAFDCLIGNTDRHPENWGFMATFTRGQSRLAVAFAPLFDHGTSLSYEVSEDNVSELLNPARLESYIKRGRHHVRWDVADAKSAGHFDLCHRYAQQYPDARAEMSRVAGLPLDGLAEMLSGCTKFDLPNGKLSHARADFLHKLLVARQNRLLEMLR